MAIGTTTALLLGGGALAGMGFSRMASRGVQQVSAPTPLPQPPSPEVSAEKASDVVKKKKAQATQSVYTSPLGVAGQADVARKVLLGQ